MPVSPVTGEQVAAYALRWRGYGYVWGGRAAYPGDWDCSSFASFVLGKGFNLPLPGGHWGAPGYPPNTHGPTTLSYRNYGRGILRSQVSAGDLIVWPTHMGIAIDHNRMMSARSPANGTGIDYIDGDIPSEIPRYRRVVGPGGAQEITTGEFDLGGRDVKGLLYGIAKQLWFAGENQHRSAMSIRKHRLYGR